MEEINLLSIISVNQDNLKKNFNLLLNKIKEHDKLIVNLNQKIEAVDKHFDQKVNQARAEASLYSDQQISNIKRIFQARVTQFQEMQTRKLQQQCSRIQQSAKDDMEYKLLTFSQQIQRENGIIHERVVSLAQKIEQQLGRKEDRTQVEKIRQQLFIFQQQQQTFEGKLKYFQHNVQKVMILEQKAFREKQKREKQMMKQLQQKFTKQIQAKVPSFGSKGRFGNPGSISQLNINNNSNLSHESQSDQKTNKYIASFNEKNNQNQSVSLKETAQEEQKGINNHQNSKQLERQTEYLKEEQQNDNADSPMTKMLQNTAQSSNILYDFEKQARVDPNNKLILDFISGLEVKIKGMNKRINEIQRSTNLFKKQTEFSLKQNSLPIQKLKQKILEIKQDISKNDTRVIILSDKISCAEKKIEESRRDLQKIFEEIKLNGFNKINQKIKQIQAQITTSFRDVNTKIQGKTNHSEYEKYRQALQQRLSNMNQQILIKSDKIQVKKALVFLESKIKEIILVIAREESSEKEALLTKKHLKCMSCDKEVDTDKFVGSISFKKANWDGMPLKETQLQNAGKFAVANFGTLVKKSKKESINSESRSTLPSIQQRQFSNSICY